MTKYPAIILTSLSFLLIGLYVGCSSDNTVEKDSVAIRVNDSQITLEEFNELLKFESYADPELELTRETRDQFINYLVRKELMIQEAARLKLDRKEEFIRTIEKYWESTLIRNLLDHMSEKLRKKIFITEEEIKQYYLDNRARYDNTPFDEVRDDIKKTLEIRRLETKLEEWTESLREQANIRVDKELINNY